MAAHSSVLAWRIPGTGEAGGLPSMGSHRVGHNWSNLAAAAVAWVRKIPWRRKWQTTLVFLPGEFHGQRSLVGYNPWGLKSIRHNWVIKQQQYPYEAILENPVRLLEALLVLKHILTFSRTELTKREHRIGSRGQKEIGRGQWRKKGLGDSCMGEIHGIILPWLHTYKPAGICSPKAVLQGSRWQMLAHRGTSPALCPSRPDLLGLGSALFEEGAWWISTHFSQSASHLFSQQTLTE